MTHKKSKTQFIEENRDIRMFLDVIEKKIQNGEFDHVYRLIKTDTDVKKEDGKWIIKENIKSMTISEITNSIERSRTDTLNAVKLIREQMLNYSKILNERELIMTDEEDKADQLNKLEEKYKKSEERYQRQLEKQRKDGAQAMRRHAEHEEEYQINSYAQVWNEAHEHNHKLRTDPVYAIRHFDKSSEFPASNLSQVFIKIPSTESYKVITADKLLENYFKLDPVHPETKLQKGIIAFFEENDRLINVERLKKLRTKAEEEKRKEHEAFIEEMEKKARENPIMC